MKKGKFSVVEKHFIRRIFNFFLLQILMILVFLYCFDISRPVGENDIKQVVVTVEDTRFIDEVRHDKLFVYSGADRYAFYRSNSRDDLYVRQLYETINVGDQLHLSYTEILHIFFGKVNLIVDAKNETQTYRTIEAYNQSKHGLFYFVIIVGILVEITFIFVVFLEIRFEKKKIKGIVQKTKKRLRNAK